MSVHEGNENREIGTVIIIIIIHHLGKCNGERKKKGQRVVHQTSNIYQIKKRRKRETKSITNHHPHPPHPLQP